MPNRGESWAATISVVIHYVIMFVAIAGFALGIAFQSQRQGGRRAHSPGAITSEIEKPVRR